MTERTVDGEDQVLPVAGVLDSDHSDGYDSDVSDGGGYLSPEKDETHMHDIRLRVMPTKNSAVQTLFNNTDKVSAAHNILITLLTPNLNASNSGCYSPRENIKQQ